MPNTTNYNWATPADTDLVKDGAAAIRTLGSSADTTVKNLNPGTTAGDIDYYTSSTAKARVAIGSAGQVLRVNSGGNAPEWATTADQTPLTTKGDLFTFTTIDARLGVGANGTLLTADSAEATGLKWVAPASSSGPAFSVYRNQSQSVTASTWVKVQFDVEDYDTDSCYDNATNYRFTPNKSGYYQLNYNVQVESGSGCFVALYKNGSIFHYGFKQSNAQNNHGGACIVVNANGSSDYFEVYANGGTGASIIINWGTDRKSMFSGVWIRS